MLMKKYLIILIIFILFYYLHKYCIKIEIEKFTSPLSTNLPYTADDLNAIRTLGLIAKDLQEGGGLKIPGNILLSDKHILSTNTIDNILELKDKSSNDFANMKVKNFNVTGVSNLVPRGTVVAWNYTSESVNAAGVVIPPATWALCDGTTVNGIQTPDLRSRFILGAGKGGLAEPNGIALSNRVQGTSGGFETVKLDVTEIPPHAHGYTRRTAGATAAHGSSYTVARADWESTQSTGIACGTADGQTARHENMPPFYVLAYIMKL